MNCPHCKLVVLEEIKTNPPGALQCPRCKKTFLPKSVENPSKEYLHKEFRRIYKQWLLSGDRQQHYRYSLELLDFIFSHAIDPEYDKITEEFEKKNPPEENPPRFVAVEEDDTGFIVILSMPTTKESAEEMAKVVKPTGKKGRITVMPVKEAKTRKGLGLELLDMPQENPATHHVTGINKETGKRHIVSLRMSLEMCRDFINSEPPHGGKGVWDKMRIIEWKTGKEVE